MTNWQALGIGKALAPVSPPSGYTRSIPPHPASLTWAWLMMAARQDASVALSGMSDRARDAMSGSPEGGMCGHGCETDPLHNA